MASPRLPQWVLVLCVLLPLVALIAAIIVNPMAAPFACFLCCKTSPFLR